MGEPLPAAAAVLQHGARVPHLMPWGWGIPPRLTYRAGIVGAQPAACKARAAASTFGLAPPHPNNNTA